MFSEILSLFCGRLSSICDLECVCKIWRNHGWCLRKLSPPPKWNVYVEHSQDKVAGQCPPQIGLNLTKMHSFFLSFFSLDVSFCFIKMGFGFSYINDSGREMKSSCMKNRIWRPIWKLGVGSSFSFFPFVFIAQVAS